jgi:hypothetical protein
LTARKWSTGSPQGDWDQDWEIESATKHIRQPVICWKICCKANRVKRFFPRCSKFLLYSSCRNRANKICKEDECRVLTIAEARHTAGTTNLATKTYDLAEARGNRKPQGRKSAWRAGVERVRPCCQGNCWAYGQDSNYASNAGTDSA